MQPLFNSEFKDTLDNLKSHVEDVSSIAEQIELHRAFLEELIKEVALVRSQMEVGFNQYLQMMEQSSVEMRSGFDHALSGYQQQLTDHAKQAETNQLEVNSLQETWWKEKNDDLIKMADLWKSDLNTQLDLITTKLDVWKKDHIQTFMSSLQTNIDRYANIFKKQSEELNTQFTEHADLSITSLNTTTQAIQELGSLAESSAEKLSVQIEQTREAIDWWVVHSKELADRQREMHKDLEAKHEELLVREIDKVKDNFTTHFETMRNAFENQCGILVNTAKGNLDRQKDIQDELMERVEKLSIATGPLIETLDSLVKQLQAFKLKEEFDTLHKKLAAVDIKQLDIFEKLKLLENQIKASDEKSRETASGSFAEIEKRQKFQQTLTYALYGLLVLGFFLVIYYIGVNSF